MGYDVDPEEMQALASKLTHAAGDLDDGASAPPPPVQAGEVTDAVTSLLGALSSSLAGVVEGVGAAGDAVTSGRDSYLAAEDDARADISKVEPR